MSRKLLCFLCAAALLTGLMVWRVQEPVVLKLGVFAGSAWDVPSPDCYEVIDVAIEIFEAENPGIRVEYESGIVKDDYSSWISQKILEGDAPDVFMILPEDFNTLADIHALKNLDPWMDLDPDAFYSSALEAGQYESGQLALPFEANPQLLFVNTTILDQAGLTLSEEGYDLDSFYEACAQVSRDQDGDGFPETFGISEYSWKEAVNAYGLDLFSEDGAEVSLNTAEFRQALQYVADLQALNTPSGKQTPDFDEGNTAFAIMTFAQYRTYAPYPWKIKRFSSFDWQASLMPSASENSRIEMPVLQMGISAHTLLPQASWKLLKTLCGSEEVQSLIYESSQGVSALKAAGASYEEDLLDAALLEKVMNQLSDSCHFENYESAVSRIDQESETLISQEQDLDLALIRLEKEINRILIQ